MAEAAVSFLLNHLSVLLDEERHLLGGLKGEVVYIQDEMLQMREFLRVADANEETNGNLKEWILLLREISYDVEDVLDKYMLRFGRHCGTSGFHGYMKSFYGSIRKLIARHHIASEIQAIKYRLDNVSKSQQRYREMCDVVYQGSSSKYEWFDSRCNALFLEEADVVGIEKPKKQLIEWIRSMDEGREVISVVGMGGLGKTTLVKKVYDDESVKRRFDQHVWVVASDFSNVKHLLTNLIKKLVEEIKKSPPQGLEEMSVDEMRSFIFEFLKDKKYIIVLDDVWNIDIWEAISFALPKRGVHGCIIVTTRFNHIGNVVCTETNHVYNLQPLPIQESEELFYKKAFLMKPCPPYLRIFVERILRRCQGLPLAIVVIGGLLATKDDNVEEWEMFSRSLGHELGEDGSLQVLGKIFSLGYNDLPWYLKYCYLYLSIFPEDDLLEKEKIIRLWIAEGFVQSKQDKTLEEVASGYLNELYSRSLIQVAESQADGRARAFRIHDLLRDYIISKSREHNIVTVCNGGEMQWPGRIRRFSIQKSFSFSQETYNFECLRSLILMWSENIDIGIINELVSKCRLLKVLDLRGAPLETIPDGVFKLYHLKLLCLRNTMVSFIPKSIGSLQNLEMLDLKNCNVTELPIEILKLHKLRHLLVYRYKSNVDLSFYNTQSCKVPCNIGSYLPALVKLCCVDATESDGIKMVMEIGKLTHLRRLGIFNLRSEDGKELCSSIAKLSNLRSLTIHSVQEGEKLDLDYSISLPFLRTLELSGWLERVPQWIQSLEGLTTLYLGWSRLREGALNSLQNLSNLSSLYIHSAYIEGLCFKALGFQKLKHLWLGQLNLMKEMIVEKGCMPIVEELIVEDCPMLIELPQGIEHLMRLRCIEFDNMKKEFMENVVEVQRNEGINWRLASVRVYFYNYRDGEWRLDLAL